VEATNETTRLLHQTLLGDAWENAEDAVVLFDDERQYIAFNEAWCRFTGYTRDEILALRAGGSLAVGAEDRSRFDEVLREQHGVGSATIRRKDGATIRVGYRVVATKVALLPYFIALVWREPSA
jgi:PAS domain S-box-containing protein